MKRQVGWAVAACAIRETEERYNVRVRPFTVGLDVAVTKAGAEAYARERMAELWTPEVGWQITVVAMPVTMPLGEEHV